MLRITEELIADDTASSVGIIAEAILHRTPKYNNLEAQESLNEYHQGEPEELNCCPVTIYRVTTNERNFTMNIQAQLSEGTRFVDIHTRL